MLGIAISITSQRIPLLRTCTDQVLEPIKQSVLVGQDNQQNNFLPIEHYRHRSRWKFLSNLMAGRANYCLNPSKPRLFFSNTEIEAVSS
ncbi:hypothetical protein [Candidatus Protochlamydia amoebophila]|uniref:Uncharacterized protein n=1 Tax=Candidatus Protochlamydia amoebophila TaxID=362787 RepID=A0A0C1JKH4_9BACT|nr:hypothetical protein [Candidatus Protochlamydia amoebophila]KIC71790.1 hypothetical protein DB44_CY00010 [Candidatus Protochlamydia amoebophila]